MRPKVSVLMAVYNGEKYMREAIDSILGQTFTDFEFIIIDDGSTDRSVDIVSAYSDQRIRFIRSEQNAGLTASLNKGLEVVRGEYVARMDCDDISLPERLAKQVAFLDANPEVGACSTWALDIDQDGNVIGKRETLTGEQLDNFYWRTSLIHPAAMLRFAPDCDLRYDDAMPYSQDYDLWLRIKSKYKLGNLPEYLLLYRVHDKSISTTRADKQIHTAYGAFCQHIGTRAISYNDFLALMCRSHELNPVRRARATRRLARRLRKPYSLFFNDDIEYLRSWSRLRGISSVSLRTLVLRAFRYLRRQIRSCVT